MARAAVVAASVAAAVLATSCVGGSGGTGAPTNPPAQGLTAEQRAALVEAQEMSKSRSPGEQAAALRQYENVRAQLIADCMRSYGFHYEPYTPTTASVNTAAGMRPDILGFGISTTIDQHAMSPGPGAAAPVADPNLAIRNRLSAQDRAGYDRALPECQAQAQRKVGLPPGMVVVTGDNGAAVDEAMRQANTDTRVVRATRAWSACMTAAGFGGTSRSELLASLQERAAPFREIYISAQQAEPGKTVPLANILNARQRQELAALQRYEIRAAIADRRCDKGLSEITSQVFQEKFRVLLHHG